ncbi:hypothetical protein Bca52824_083420 [Brassica carinata]|uniref:Uncharacterized protein n=1 Tax=Brassica carinata TaxID=52824 RepID=A0A8X7PPD1_BRACI|nr:hypothetical protein Bca52824_083420 [Brassica carinata]
MEEPQRQVQPLVPVVSCSNATPTDKGVCVEAAYTLEKSARLAEKVDALRDIFQTELLHRSITNPLNPSLNRKIVALAAPETLTGTDVSVTPQPKQPLLLLAKKRWEELKSTLEAKPWISQKKMIILLNQATDIINLWQQSGGNLTSQ